MRQSRVNTGCTTCQALPVEHSGVQSMAVYNQGAGQGECEWLENRCHQEKASPP